MKMIFARKISNGLGKKVVKNMGPNKKISSITKVCTAVSGIKDIIDNYDASTGKKKPSSRHTKLDPTKMKKI